LSGLVRRDRDAAFGANTLSGYIRTLGIDSLLPTT
jgi:hypothetical protein